jgi:hypothetical protein
MNPIINIAGMLLYASVMTVVSPLLLIVHILLATWKLVHSIHIYKPWLRITQRNNWKPLPQLSIHRNHVMGTHH